MALAGKLRVCSDKPAAQKARHVELLPSGKIIAHDDGNFGLEAHDSEFERRWRHTS